MISLLNDSSSRGAAEPDRAPSGPKPVAQPFDAYDAAFLLALAVYLYANLFADPRTPFLLGGDQLYFWMDAQRLLHGEQVYRDFFQITPPGTDLIYLSVFRLFGPHIWTTNLVVLVLGVALCSLCLRISKSVMPRPRAALATTMFLVIVYAKMLIGTHHWFSVLAVLGAIAILMAATSPARTAIAGGLLGVAAFFTQTRGPVAAVAVAVWMTWNRSQTREPWAIYLRRLILLFAPMIAVWTALSSYYIATLGLRQFLYFQTTYVQQNMLTAWYTPWLRLPHSLSWTSLSPAFQSLAAYVVLAPTYAFCLWKCFRARREAPCAHMARIALLSIAGAAMFLEVAQSPSWLRFYCVAAPGIILLVWLTGGLGKFTGYASRSAWIAVVALAAHQTYGRHRTNSAIGELPGGRVATTQLAAEKLAWFAAHTQPEQFMLQAMWPGLYLPLALRNPLYLEDLETSGQGRLGYVALSIRQLEAKRVQYIVWSPVLNSPMFELEPLREFVEVHYHRVWTFPDEDEVWAHKP